MSRLADPPSVAQARWFRAALLLAALVVPQVVLFGRSLVGQRILLPLDILRAIDPRVLRDPQAVARNQPWNWMLSDQVTQHEPWRRYVADSVRSGRIPLWHSANFAGYPILAANQPAVFSPYRLVDYLWPGPAAVAWGQLLRAMVAGCGAFWWCRKAMGLGYGASLAAGAAYPLTGTQMLWVGCPHAAVTTWLPWLLLATDSCVRRPLGLGGPALALTTAAALVSGHASFAAHLMLASGLYGLWLLWDEYRIRRAWGGAGWAALLALSLGWGSGVLLSGPQTLPTLEYLPWSLRMANRVEHQVAPIDRGWTMAAQLAFPNVYGSDQRGSLYLRNGNRQESGAAGYCGLMALAVAAPLGWCRKECRRQLWALAVLGVVGAGDLLALPGLAQLYELFPLSTLRNNRFVFLTGFVVLCWAAAGLDALWKDQWRWQPWCWTALAAPVLAALVLGLTGLNLPSAVLTAIARRVPDVEQAREVVGWFRNAYWQMAIYGLIAGCLWLALRRASSGSLVAGVIALAWVLELLRWGATLEPQCSPQDYYPPSPVLAQLAERAQSQPGRICGYGTLLPNLNQMAGLIDIRGYDGVDPAHLIEVLRLAAQPGQVPSPEYAATQFYLPGRSPLLDMLAVRYIVYPCPVPEGRNPLLAGDDYWVEERPSALPRAYVPRGWQTTATAEETLALLGQANFNPRQVALVDRRLPDAGREVTGEAQITVDKPETVHLRTRLSQPGVVVLADLWMPGWKAYHDGVEIPLLRVNHVLRGAYLPAGERTLVFRYEPRAFVWGLGWGAAGAMLVAAWGLLAAWLAPRSRGKRQRALG